MSNEVYNVGAVATDDSTGFKGGYGITNAATRVKVTTAGGAGGDFIVTAGKTFKNGLLIVSWSANPGYLSIRYDDNGAGLNEVIVATIGPGAVSTTWNTPFYFEIPATKYLTVVSEGGITNYRFLFLGFEK